MGCVPSNSGTAEKPPTKRPMSHQTKVGNMGLTLYYHPLSQPSRSVYMFCKLNKIPFTEKVVDLMHGENKKEEYLKINANGAVPAIVDDDFNLSECMTILKYLARKYKAPNHCYPADLQTQARVNEYLDWHHTGLRSKGVDVYMGMVLIPMTTGNPIDEDSLATNLEKLDKSFSTIEKTFLGDKKFIAGDEISIADLCAINEMTQVFSVQRTDLLASYPKLQAWRDRVYTQLKMDPSSDELHSTLRSFAAKAQQNTSPTKVDNMVLTVYYHPLSQPSRSVYMFCKLNKIPFTEKVVDLMTGENRKEEYLKINANGAVPAISDDGFNLSECMTVLKYLARKYKVANNWFSTDLKTEARINEYLDWHHTGLRSKGVDIYVGMVFTPMMTGNPIDEDSLAKNFEKLDKSFSTIEKTFLGDKKFIAGDEISIADLCAINEMTQVFSVQRTDLLASYPKLQAWRDRVYTQLKMDPSSDELHSTLRSLAPKK